MLSAIHALKLAGQAYCVKLPPLLVVAVKLVLSQILGRAVDAVLFPSIGPEKSVLIRDLIYSRTDAINGAAATDIVVFFIVVACATAIYVNGIRVSNIADISPALLPLAGQFVCILFAFESLNECLFAASILPLLAAYVVIEGSGFEAGVSRGFREALVFNSLYLGIIVLGALSIMIPNDPLLSIPYISQIINGILLPVVLMFVLLIIMTSG